MKRWASSCEPAAPPLRRSAYFSSIIWISRHTSSRMPRLAPSTWSYVMATWSILQRFSWAPIP
eukprot:8200417-Heterocapsa_arctica.AAC.1